MIIVWDVQNHIFLSSLSSTQQINRLNWFLRDQVPISLYYATPNASDTGYTAAAFPVGWSARCSVKHSGSFSGDPLVFQGSWTEQTDGDGNTYYSATLDLNTTELIAAMGATDPYDVLLEFVLQDVSGNNRDSTQVTLRLKPDVHRVSDLAPSSALAPWLEFFTDEAGLRCLRIKNDIGETLEILKPMGA